MSIDDSEQRRVGRQIRRDRRDPIISTSFYQRQQDGLPVSADVTGQSRRGRLISNAQPTVRQAVQSTRGYNQPTPRYDTIPRAAAIDPAGIPELEDRRAGQRCITLSPSSAVIALRGSPPVPPPVGQLIDGAASTVLFEVANRGVFLWPDQTLTNKAGLIDRPFELTIEYQVVGPLNLSAQILVLLCNGLDVVFPQFTQYQGGFMQGQINNLTGGSLAQTAGFVTETVTMGLSGSQTISSYTVALDIANFNLQTTIQVRSVKICTGR